ncbi:MAG: diadenylate cyclase CdaA [Verrucomicrobiota bacterium]
MDVYFSSPWRAAVEILILTVLFYQLYKHFRKTRGARILTGFVVLLLTLTLVSELLDLVVIGTIIKSISAILALALVVTFQPELRRLLGDLGSHRLFSITDAKREQIELLVEAIQQLSNKRFGALIAIERGIELTQYSETGVTLNAEVSTELLLSIFHPRASLHDGGVVLDKDKIAAAGCVFPLSQREMQDRSIGLRHRAGVGVTEESDAIAIIVSEETGSVSLCQNGELMKGLKPEAYRRKLGQWLFPDTIEEEDQPKNERPVAGELEVETGGAGSGGDRVVPNPDA